MHTTWPTHLIVHDTNTLTIFCKVYKFRTWSLCNFIYPAFTAMLFGSNIPLSTVFKHPHVLQNRPKNRLFYITLPIFLKVFRNRVTNYDPWKYRWSIIQDLFSVVLKRRIVLQIFHLPWVYVVCESFKKTPDVNALSKPDSNYFLPLPVYSRRVGTTVTFDRRPLNSLKQATSVST
jgi:hypothetical protein